MGGVSYAYDGDGDRVSRTVGGTLTRYLLDKQTPLTLVLSETTSGATKRYMHGPTGIFGQQKNTQAVKWGTNYLLQDGLGSVRAISDGMDVLSAQAYSPYGEPLQTALPTDFGFTGEQTDPLNDLVYLRARYLNPRLGVFGSRDPFAGENSNPLSLNRYNWVQGNSINYIDPQGFFPISPCPTNDTSCINNTVDQTLDTLLQFNSVIDLTLSFGAAIEDIIPPWAKSALELAPIFSWVSNLELLFKAQAAWNKNDHFRAFFEISKFIPIWGNFAQFMEDTGLNPDAATPPPQNNPDLARCYSAFGATIISQEQTLANLYLRDCQSQHYLDPLNPGVCTAPTEQQITSGLEVVDALQARGYIPYDLSAATHQDIMRYSQMITVNDPYWTSLWSSNSGIGSSVNPANYGIADSGLDGVGTLSAFLLLTRNLQSNQPTNLNAFRNVFTQAGHPMGSATNSWGDMTNNLRDGTWQNVISCDFNH